MDQNATAALITAIIAIVLGALGLIGGVVGYVQGAAALRRATAARQRAAIAEEAALQARAAAEATLRTTEELLERRRPKRPEEIQTGPITLPDLEPRSRIRSRGAAASPGTPEGGTDPVPVLGDGSASSAGQAEPIAEAAPVPVDDADPGPIEATFDEPTEDAVEAPEPPEPEETDSDPVAAAESMPSGSETDTEGPASTAAVEDQPEAAAETGSAIVPDGAPDSETDRAPDVDTDTAPEADSGTDADEPDGAIPEPSNADVPASDGGEAAAADGGGATEPARPGRGQISAASTDAPTMDWAEALKTGAIPLPAKSRGTYSAPRRRPKPTGKGPARFELKMIGRQRFEAVNVGGEAAPEAVVEGIGDDPHLIRPLSTRPITVQPGGTLAFSVLKVEGRDPSVQVHWTRAGETVQQELPLA